MTYACELECVKAVYVLFVLCASFARLFARGHACMHGAFGKEESHHDHSAFVLPIAVIFLVLTVDK